MRIYSLPAALCTLFVALVALPVPAHADALWQACSGGDAEACLEGSRDADAQGEDARLERFISQGCALGNVIACSNRGVRMLMAGKDLPEAIRLVRAGCEAGYGRACANLGWATYSGIGVKKDPATAAGYYQTGCDKGSGPACRNLGLMYDMGDGVKANAARADALFRRACDLGPADLC